MFAHNVKVIRLMKGMNQSDLAKYLGYGSTAAVCQWETNNAIPHFSTLDKIAKLGNITVDELLHKDINSINDERNKSDISSSIRINVYSSVHAGIPNEAIDEVVDWEDIPKEWFTSGREYFGVKVRGNSMEPEYRNGDTVIVQKQSTFIQEAFNCKGSDIIMQGDVPVLHIRGTKTANADRFVPIPTELYNLIKDLPKGEYISIYKNGNKITNDNRPRLWKWLWRKMNIEAGTKMYRNALVEPYLIPQDFVPYCLRHEFCSNLARKGIDIRVAQKLMGHAQISLTANIYTHIDNEEMIQNVAKILSDVPTIIPTDDENH